MIGFEPPIFGCLDWHVQQQLQHAELNKEEPYFQFISEKMKVICVQNNQLLLSNPVKCKTLDFNLECLKLRNDACLSHLGGYYMSVLQEVYRHNDACLSHPRGWGYTGMCCSKGSIFHEQSLAMGVLFQLKKPLDMVKFSKNLLKCSKKLQNFPQNH